MGLSAFSRARVSQLPVLELEGKRFEEWNQAHQAGIRAQDEMHSTTVSEETITEVREADQAAVLTIGEKVVAGLSENTAEGDPVDKQLREDHVRDMVGRRHVVDPQGEPQSILDRLHDRIPTGSPASVALVAKTDVDSEGPTKEEVDAAEEEQAPWVPPEDAPELRAMTDEQLEAAIARHDDPSSLTDAELEAEIAQQEGV